MLQAWNTADSNPTEYLENLQLQISPTFISFSLFHHYRHLKYSYD